METTEINSVSDLSQILQTLGEPEKGHTRFFRGHGDKDWQMLPSIYRETYLIENEDKIIKDALTYCPDDFLPSDTLFEKLVKLQHYGYSTRLLDLTTNALVALYFAASPYSNKDGELIILDIPDTEIKYGDSDTVAILSAISLRPSTFKISDAIDLANGYKHLAEYEYNGIFKNIPSYPNEYEFKKHMGEKGNLDFHTYSELITTPIQRRVAEEGKKAFSACFNSNEDILSLLHDIQTDKPSFRPVIESSDLQRVICVRAKLNNARISRQQGCFLLFGIKGCKTEAAAIPAEWQPSALSSQKILVKAESKADIRQELESFGISKRTLFPELEAQAKEIMEQYNPDSKKP